MDWQRVFTMIVALLGSGVWYGLQVYALRDLARRPRVRGDNKVLWALVILCLPIFGALSYLITGPTSFLPRRERPARTTDPPGPVPLTTRRATSPPSHRASEPPDPRRRSRRAPSEQPWAPQRSAPRRPRRDAAARQPVPWADDLVANEWLDRRHVSRSSVPPPGK